MACKHFRNRTRLLSRTVFRVTQATCNILTHNTPVLLLLTITAIGMIATAINAPSVVTLPLHTAIGAAACRWLLTLQHRPRGRTSLCHTRSQGGGQASAPLPEQNSVLLHDADDEKVTTLSVTLTYEQIQSSMSGSGSTSSSNSGRQWWTMQICFAHYRATSSGHQISCKLSFVEFLPLGVDIHFNFHEFGASWSLRRQVVCPHGELGSLHLRRLGHHPTLQLLVVVPEAVT